ncbi:hypothetical protein [Nocardioides bruguierae]|uniref:hypothetical protein n=1 Tax=Nocardioides bruguierae TaxID=2945102 RepID=UPI002021CD68|nr:hypothetical protein [Nocardioides bruguierae]MCL8024358.1 hypothetical protein [Nocardioides bruguierae]
MTTDTDLTDRLAALRDGPAVGATPEHVRPDDTWARGRRHARRARAVQTVVVAAVLAVVLGTGTVGWLKAQQPDAIAPAGATDGLALPDTFDHVATWAPERALDSGPFVALQNGRHGQLFGGTTPVLAAVGPDGSVGTLDLPGLLPLDGSADPAETVAISASGRYVAWFYEDADRTSDALDTTRVVADGVGRLDSLTGEVEQFAFETQAVVGNGLGFAGEDLLVPIWEPLGGSRTAATAVEVLAWRSGADEPETSAVPVAFDAGLPFAVPGVDGTLVDSTSRWVRFVTADGVVARVPTPAGPGSWLAASSPDGPVTVLRQVRGTDAYRVLRAGTTGEAPSSVDADHDLFAVVGWRDPQTVVGLEYSSDRPPAYVAIDLVDGSSVQLSTFVPSRVGYALPLVAADAWTAPVAATGEPADPLDPRLLYGVPLLAIGLGLGGLALWRRRARI